MPEDRELDSPLREKKKESNGEWLVRTLKPFGCFLVLALTVLFLVVCFTSGPKPVEGYAPPHDSGYYALHPEELAEELEENLLPHLEGVEGCRVADDGSAVELRLAEETFARTRAAILQYYDRELFVFLKAGD